MRFSVYAILGALAATTLARPAPDTHSLHEKREASMKTWVKRNKVHGSAVLPMRIGLTQRNIEYGHDHLMDIADHQSENYGKHWTAEEVHDFFSPSDAAVASVREWLEGAGIAADRIRQSVNKQWMQLEVSTEEAENLLHADYFLWENTDNGKMNVACDEYHVPSHVQEHIDYITPGIRLMSMGKKTSVDEHLKKRSIEADKTVKRGISPLPAPSPLPGGTSALQNMVNQGLLQFCDSVVTPPCIAAFYNITQATKAAPSNKLGIFEDTDFYAAEDLVEFFAILAPNIPPTTAPVLEGVDGGVAPSLVAGGESDLDFQISYPIIYPQNSVLFQTDDLHYELDYTYTGLFNNFLDAIDGSYCTFTYQGEGPNSPLDPPYPDPFPVGGYNKPRQCGVYKPTNVISFSYGEQEADLPAAYQKRQCQEYMKLGMQGVSLIFASGDSGVAGRQGDNGQDDGCLGATGNIFSPDFPASCPYLTAVGSTFLPTGGDPKKDQEVATTRFGSGGGFSNIYDIPSYQNSAVQTYLSQHTPPYKSYCSTGGTNSSFGAGGGVYNRCGRAYPDVSAIGDNVLIFLDGAPMLIGGTSAAAPVFAAILNRINEERIAVGKKPVGFVNPTLYAHPEVLHDITVGDNPGCNTNGFNASTGWDPVTGLGTPNYPAMLNLFMSMA